MLVRKAGKHFYQMESDQLKNQLYNIDSLLTKIHLKDLSDLKEDVEDRILQIFWALAYYGNVDTAFRYIMNIAKHHLTGREF